METPAERARRRQAASRPHHARTPIHEGGHIIIEIADDGRGLPLDRIKARKALSRGPRDRGRARRHDRAADPASSSSGPASPPPTEVTAVSGRGVGLDVVRTNIEQHRRHHRDRRASRAGARPSSIKIPLTLAIVSALIVAAAASVSPFRRSRGGTGAARAPAPRHRIEWHQRHAGAAAARPAAAAGVADATCCAWARTRWRGTALRRRDPGGGPARSASSSIACSTPRRSW